MRQLKKRKTPLIGVVSAVAENARSFVLINYIRSIECAGADVIVLPYTERVDAIDRFGALCDGFLFTGGVDIEPSRYGEETQKTCGTVDTMRDEFDFLCFDRLLATNKPILGICRGNQLINVALGGSLYQDVPSEIGTVLCHRQGEPHSAPAHKACILEETPLFRLFDCKVIDVNSLHHQSVKRFGKGLKPMAVAADGVVEAIYLPTHRFLWGIQWHPERSQEEDENSRKIFSAFVNACLKNSKDGVTWKL